MSNSQALRLLRSVLAIWTGVLVALIATLIGSIPTLTLVAILPYLGLVAWHLLVTPGWIEVKTDSQSKDSTPLKEPDPVAQESTSPSSNIIEPQMTATETPPTVPLAEPRPSMAAPARARRRVKPRIVAEPSPASWVQVGPGRFVRDEHAHSPVDVPEDPAMNPPHLDPPTVESDSSPSPTANPSEELIEAMKDSEVPPHDDPIS